MSLQRTEVDIRGVGPAEDTLKAMMYNPYKRKLQLRKKQNQPIKKCCRNIQLKLSSPSQKNDNKWFGSNLVGPPKRSDTRFLLLNINGIKRNQDKNHFRSQLTSILEKHVHYFSLTEINMNCLNKTLKNNTIQTFEQILPNGAISMTNTPIMNPKVEYQPGGVAAGFFGMLNNRYINVKFDKYGRWLFHEFSGQSAKVRIYTLYRVNPKTNKGHTTAWIQQETALLKNGVTENPRKHVITEMLKELRHSLQNGYEILLLADMNETVDAVEKTNSKLNQIGLTNIFQNYLYNLPRTHKNGSKAIDHIWGSKRILEAVSQIGMAPFNYVTKTDHRGLFIDLNLSTLLDENKLELKTAKFRKLKMSNPKKVQKYVKNLEEQWSHHNMNKKFKKLNEYIKKDHINSEELRRKLNTIDNEITNILDGC